jgi:hypothetical protein
MERVTRHADPAQWARFRDPSGPDIFGGTGWWAVALLLASLVLYGWDVIRRLHEAEPRGPRGLGRGVGPDT